jgi:hypothetical protein
MDQATRCPRRWRPENALLLGKIKDGTEDEFDYEDDWGTIARFESFLGRAVPTFSDRLLRDGQFPVQKFLCVRPRPSSLLLVP